MTHDYTRKGGVVYTEILLPDNAPSEYANRAVLWNAVEQIEKADNSQLAREIELALPIELTREQNISLVRNYVKKTFVASGMCADFCVHDKDDGNPHTHIMLTMRPFDEHGKWGGKQKKEYILDKDGSKIYDPQKRQYKCRSIPSTDWNNRNKADEWRAAWEGIANEEIKRLGFDARIDHRTYGEQGIQKIPTIHMGVAATQMEQRGIVTERGNQNREIAHTNGIIFAIIARLKQLRDWLKETIAPAANAPETEKPSILAQLKGYKAAIAQSAKPESHMLDDLYARFTAAREKLRQVDRRLECANGVEEYDKILPERWKAYNEYSALRAEVKKAEKHLPGRRAREREER